MKTSHFLLVALGIGVLVYVINTKVGRLKDDDDGNDPLEPRHEPPVGSGTK